VARPYGLGMVNVWDRAINASSLAAAAPLEMLSRASCTPDLRSAAEPATYSAAAALSDGRRLVGIIDRHGDAALVEPPFLDRVGAQSGNVQRIGPGECDPVEILALLLSGDFDIVHFSGHGDYNPLKRFDK